MKLSLKPHRVLAILAGCGLVAASFASCADDADAPTAADLDSGPSDPFAVDSGVDASGDADAEAAAPIPSCDVVEWCGVSTSLDSRVFLSSIWGSGKSDIWASGSNGHVLHFDGTTWVAAPAPTTQSLYAIGGTGSNDVWTVSSANAIFHSKGFTSGAANWTLETTIPHLPPNPRGFAPQLGPILKALWPRTAADIWVGGEALIGTNFDYETVWHAGPASDGGIPWDAAHAGEPDDVNAIWGSGANDVWVAGTTAVSHTTGNLSDAGVPGYDWTSYDVPSVGAIFGLWGSGPGDVWGVGAHGVIVHFTAALGQWRAVASGTVENLRAIWGAAANDIWIVGDSGTLLHYDGTTWRTSTGAFSPSAKPNLLGVWGSSSSDIWAVGSETILHFTGAK